MERPDSIIIDASVVVKWFVDEDYTDRALRMLNDYKEGEIMIYSVQLMPYEVINALRYDPVIGKGDLIRIGNALEKFQIGLYPLLNGIYELAINIAIDSGTTLYDASYLALAMTIDGYIYTADQRFMNKISRYGRVFHLSSYK